MANRHPIGKEMTLNPYESPGAEPLEESPAPLWYVWFYHAYYPAWLIGTVLIALSWFDVVAPTIGWIGFALAGAAALGSYVLPSFAGVAPEEYVFLDSRLLRSRGAAYHEALERFRNGAVMMYDGVAFGLRPPNVIACGIVADTPAPDETAARELAAYVEDLFEMLLAESTEFRQAVSGRKLQISIVSAAGDAGRELCRVTDGEFAWISG